MRDSCSHPQSAAKNNCCCTFPADGRRFVPWWYPRGAENRCRVQPLDCKSIGWQNERMEHRTQRTRSLNLKGVSTTHSTLRLAAPSSDTAGCRLALSGTGEAFMFFRDPRRRERSEMKPCQHTSRHPCPLKRTINAKLRRHFA
jgi:hypothetical protein